MINKFILCTFLGVLTANLYAQEVSEQVRFAGYVQNKETKEGLEYATIRLISEDGSFYGGLSGEDGVFCFRNVKRNDYKLSVSFVGYKPLETTLTVVGSDSVVFALETEARRLDEVVVTASELKGITSASRIDREAMKHRQPSSFTDLLSLLPGGMSPQPKLGKSNTIRLREVGIDNDDYAVSALGTSFVIDGLPLATDANMQEVAQRSSANGGEHVNKGVDMRTIPTDQIESVEVIRGIPSVEYGDLTSGVVVVKRKLKAAPWEARFKADGSGKLFTLDKGAEFGDKGLVVSGGVDYLDARPDPRNDFVNYKRLTGAVRLKKEWQAGNINIGWQTNADYAGSFDNTKQDPEVTVSKEDSYQSVYNRFSWGNTWRVDFDRQKKSNYVELNTLLNFQHDRIRETKRVLLDRDRPIPNATEQGESDGLYLPYDYVAEVLVDGKPFTAYAKLKAGYGLFSTHVNQRFTVGVEWNMDKNYGRGQVYDAARPYNTQTQLRPRPYHSIRAGHRVSFFAEDALSVPVAAHQLRVTAGVRGMTLLNLGQDYRLQGRMYFDPRANVQWVFPGIRLGSHELNTEISGGIGWHTKMPTLRQLNPDPVYKDLVQLNYFHVNPDYKRIHIRTYVVDPTNYELAPARNRKAEVRAGLGYRANHLSVTWFRESMRSGFRETRQMDAYSYKKYEAASIDGGSLQAQPELENIPWKMDTVLAGHDRVTNGSSILKEGVEFQYSSPRSGRLKTRFTVNGAWFRTTYSNSQSLFNTQVQAVVGNVPVNDKYVGYYDWTEGSAREQFNTNFMADTYLKRLGLTFSVTAECMWFTSTRQLEKNGVPVAYMDVMGQVRPYTEADRKDPYKQWLVQNFSEALFRKKAEPFYMYINFKATKDFGKFLTLALYVDRLLDYMPDYQQLGQTVRRTAKPYFGMELNIRL